MEDEKQRGLVRQALIRYLEKKSSPRLMLSLVIAVTGLAGFLLSFVLLRLGMESMAFRYPLAALGAYAIFLGLMRIWVEYERHHLDLDDPELKAELDRPHIPLSEGGISKSKNSWLDYLDITSIGDDIAGLAFWLVAAVVGLIVVLVMVIGSAPILIAEVLLDAVLVGLLYQRLRIPATEHWLGGAIRKTWLHLLLFMALLSAVGFCLDHMVAGADTIGQAVKALLRAGDKQ